MRRDPSTARRRAEMWHEMGRGNKRGLETAVHAAPTKHRAQTGRLHTWSAHKGCGQGRSMRWWAVQRPGALPCKNRYIELWATAWAVFDCRLPLLPPPAPAPFPPCTLIRTDTPGLTPTRSPTGPLGPPTFRALPIRPIFMLGFRLMAPVRRRSPTGRQPATV